MKKESIRRPRKIIAVILIVIFATYGVFFLLYKIAYSGYEYYKTYTTADKAHDIDMYVSYPLFFTLDGRRKYKLVCKNNPDGREVEYIKFDFKPCKGCHCSLENDDGQKCTFSVFDCSEFRDFDIVWSEIFT